MSLPYNTFMKDLCIIAGGGGGGGGGVQMPPHDALSVHRSTEKVHCIYNTAVLTVCVEC